VREFPKRIRVDALTQAAMLIEKLDPAFPPSIAGKVRLSIVVGSGGDVLEVKPVAGPDTLFPAAVEAVRQWRYRPTRLNGRPVEVQSTVEL
jgi:outer membrane biosynthesis protein TonB